MKFNKLFWLLITFACTTQAKSLFAARAAVVDEVREEIKTLTGQTSLLDDKYQKDNKQSALLFAKRLCQELASIPPTILRESSVVIVFIVGHLLAHEGGHWSVAKLCLPDSTFVLALFSSKTNESTPIFTMGPLEIYTDYFLEAQVRGDLRLLGNYQYILATLAGPMTGVFYALMFLQKLGKAH